MRDMQRFASVVLAGLLLAGCGGLPSTPTELRGFDSRRASLASDNHAGGVASGVAPRPGSFLLAAPRARAVLNSSKVVVGIASLPFAGRTFNVAFTQAGLSYTAAMLEQPRGAVTFTTQTEALAATQAIAGFFNASAITPEHLGGTGDVLAPYAVTTASVPYVYTAWETLAFGYGGAFVFEPWRVAAGASAWAFFQPVK